MKSFGNSIGKFHGVQEELVNLNNTVALDSWICRLTAD